MIGQSGLAGWQPKEHVADPRDRPPKPQASLLQLLEFGNQLAYDLHMKGVVGRRHHCSKHSKLYGHFSMAEGCKPQRLRHVMPHPWGTDNGMAQLRVLGLQKGELLKMLSVLPLRDLSDPTLRHKIALKGAIFRTKPLTCT
jgi:hypothetical protein